MRNPPSVAGRALLAVALLIGFYLLAVAVVCLLLAMPYLEYRLVGRVEGRLGAFALMGAVAILWALLPRRDRFEAPGPTLREEDHPRLFQVLRGVARDTAQEMPAEVFLVPNLNAWVAQRGGIMGFGSRRVMGLGLPLLEALTVRQFRAVLAHEFGHYYGGDTRLGPWIYKTRAAIDRTLQGVHRHSAALAKPFQWYGQMFLRITHAVSRRQEFTADALAARTVGAQPLIEGLRLLHASDGAFASYWSGEVVPVLELGSRPPIAAGFRQFLAVPQVQSAMDQAVQHELAEGQAGPYDTHPCLRDRVAALAELPPGDSDGEDPPAFTLLDAPDRVESTLIAFLGGAQAQPLQSVTWEDVGERVWMPFWRARAKAHAAGLAGLTPADAPTYAADLPGLAVRLEMVAGGEDPTPAHGQQAGWIVAVALATALHDRGWNLRALPGEPVVLERDGVAIHPFSLFNDLATEQLATATWLADCLRLGVADLDLGAAVGPADATVSGTAAASIWSFVAMTYYGLILNRTYRIVVTDRWVCGVRVRGLLSSPPAPRPEYQDPEFYVNPRLTAKYSQFDPDSDGFLAIDRANFRIERDAILEVERIDRRKWGMGHIPYSGRIVLHLEGGVRKELIIVGQQNIEAIVRDLARAPALAAT
ncbi:MAG TPA: M48 family metallopeptidase [Gemmatimonadales bacterium]|nr:M48 family metallopeptidase [Gemmatimonadales bacterium]